MVLDLSPEFLAWEMPKRRHMLQNALSFQPFVVLETWGWRSKWRLFPAVIQCSTIYRIGLGFPFDRWADLWRAIFYWTGKPSSSHLP